MAALDAGPVAELALRKLMQQLNGELEAHAADARALEASERKNGELSERVAALEDQLEREREDAGARKVRWRGIKQQAKAHFRQLQDEARLAKAALQEANKAHERVSEAHHGALAKEREQRVLQAKQAEVMAAELGKLRTWRSTVEGLLDGVEIEMGACKKAAADAAELVAQSSAAAEKGERALQAAAKSIAALDSTIASGHSKALETLRAKLEARLSGERTVAVRDSDALRARVEGLEAQAGELVAAGLAAVKKSAHERAQLAKQLAAAMAALSSCRKDSSEQFLQLQAENQRLRGEAELSAPAPAPPADAGPMPPKERGLEEEAAAEVEEEAEAEVEWGVEAEGVPGQPPGQPLAQEASSAPALAAPGVATGSAPEGPRPQKRPRIDAGGGSGGGALARAAAAAGQPAPLPTPAPAGDALGDIFSGFNSGSGGESD